MRSRSRDRERERKRERTCAATGAGDEDRTTRGIRHGRTEEGALYETLQLLLLRACGGKKKRSGEFSRRSRGGVGSGRDHAMGAEEEGEGHVSVVDFSKSFCRL